MKRHAWWLHVTAVFAAIALQFFLYKDFLGDPLIDFGIGPYVAWRVAQGEILPATWMSYIPSSYYALVFKIWSVSKIAYLSANLALLILISVLTYMILRRMFSSGAAFIATIYFSWVHGFGFPVSTNFNFIAPYSYPVPVGYLLSLACLGLFQLHVKNGKKIHLWAAAAICGSLSLVKPEFFFSATVALSSGLIRLWWKRYKFITPTYLLIFLCSYLSVPTILFGITSVRMGFASAASWLFHLNYLVLSSGAVNTDYARRVMGVFDLQLTFERVGTQLLPLLAHAVGIYVLYPVMNSLTQRKAAIIWALTVFCALCVYTGLNYLQLLNGWRYNYGIEIPLIFLMCAVCQIYHSRPGADEWALITFALTVSAKVFLNAKIAYYGFFSAAPAAIYLIALIWKNSESRPAIRATIAIYLALVMLSQFDSMSSARKEMAFPYGRTVDSSKHNSAMATHLKELLLMIEKTVSEQESVAIYPHGIGLNFLARRRSGLPFPDLLPFGMETVGQENLLNEIRRSPPDYLLHLPLVFDGIMSKTWFGVDYAQEIAAFFKECYGSVAVYEPLVLAHGDHIELFKWTGNCSGKTP